MCEKKKTLAASDFIRVFLVCSLKTFAIRLLVEYFILLAVSLPN